VVIAGLLPRRRSFASIVAIGLSCLAAGCGGSGSPPATPTFSQAGYQAFLAYLKFATKLSHESGDHGLANAKINHLRPLCHRLGPNGYDLEVQGVRSWCVGGLAQAVALHDFRACAKLTTSADERCDAQAFRLYDNATTDVVAAENGILQILGTGPCYTLINDGVPQDRGLLAATDRVVAAFSDDNVTLRVLDGWEHALEINFDTAPDLSAQVRQSPACRPGPRAAAAHTTPNSPPKAGLGKVHKPIGQKAQGCACVGYLWPRQVTSVSATWTVPRLATKSPRGIAATWIGAESETRFIQIGVNEGRDVPNTDADLHFLDDVHEPLFYAFWSDTERGFHPVPLPRVKPGDVVHASLRLVGDRWYLQFSDPQASVNVSFSTPEEAGAMDQAEWLQEDVETTRGPHRFVPYPSISPVTFQDLTANGVTPLASQLLYRRRPVRSKGTLVGSLVHDNAFTIFTTKLAPAKAQYVAKADRICTATDAKIEAAQNTIGQGDLRSRAGRARTVRALNAADAMGNASLTKLRVIPKPAGSLAVLTKTWNTLAKTIHLEAELIPAVKTDNKVKFTHSLVAASAADLRYETLAQRYGFNVCGQD
jgi:hypothetical protein